MTDDARASDRDVVRYEERLDVDVEEHVGGHVHARKRVESESVSRVEPRSTEYGDVERVAAGDGDSGEIETLPDGSVSIPLFEERLVVSKELVVRERVVIRKRTVTEEHRIDAELRKERIDLEADEAVVADVERLDAGATATERPGSRTDRSGV